MRCALQLYSVRGESERDLAGTIATIGRLGLDGVELAGLHGHAPEHVREWLDAAALEVAGLHVALDDLEADPGRLSREARTLAAELLVVGWLPPSLEADVTRSYVERLDRASRAVVDEGLRLAFHTHDAELASADDGSVLLDRLVADAPQLELELDLGWAWIAGRDPGDVLASLGRRCRIVHVKDFADRADRTSFTSVGEGAVPFGDALRAARDVEWLVAEQDDGFVPDELSAALRSAAAVLDLREHLARAA
jgi:sugar phosphate isomerase/epimerase